ncbi:2-aminobenzenesulfonate 2,3-dioxygenase subunit alpha [Zhongshania aliphaticivorans]|uniref:2-aminobenzenesulfonate 2,3-dioxygenase subunit alpha n=1 Tax=Zhongshania aliphaticivorans TaxID=1470434 RepID=A0A5S9MVJ5_9GAMM|nr:SRPBCC family protein [Zhongshania aliphaticivorans]CAA0080213.1 2-aminobenzenesulfonate 2,3-dioxygenase subunit alpha [Zhongshania aliphaticivorans]CAA0085784.1 2-aminobenzenesulfonate 2,3-dioxygenase subunit alpha [Zhongshania aliphaticivorans]
MQHKDEVALLEELIGLKQKKRLFLDDVPTCNPVDDYTNPERFDSERNNIFRRMPSIIAHVSELDSPNSFLRRTINDQPLLLLRGDDNEIRVFLNVCRHRGTRLVSEQSGCKNRHSCPYHAWTWDSKGQFINGPHLETGFPGVDRSSLNLKSVPTTVRHGFIWLLPKDSPQNLVEYLNAFDSELTWAGIDRLKVYKSELQLRHCNWKILVEGGIEAYHFRVAHRKTIASLFNDNLSSYQCLGVHMRSVLPRSSITDLTGQPRDQWRIREHANVLLNIFPSNSLLLQSDHVIWISITPLSADQSEVRIVTLMPTDSKQSHAYWDKNHQLTVTTLNEDFDIGESIQSGLLSGANETLLFGRFEGALHRFNESVRSNLPPLEL